MALLKRQSPTLNESHKMQHIPSTTNCDIIIKCYSSTKCFCSSATAVMALNCLYAHRYRAAAAAAEACRNLPTRTIKQDQALLVDCHRTLFAPTNGSQTSQFSRVVASFWFLFFILAFCEGIISCWCCYAQYTLLCFGSPVYSRSVFFLSVHILTKRKKA